MGSEVKNCLEDDEGKKKERNKFAEEIVWKASSILILFVLPKNVKINKGRNALVSVKRQFTP